MVQFDAVGILQILVGLGSLICLILVWIQMFQHGETGLGILCIVLTFLCGIGGLITFIMGWVRAKPWGITNIMTAWTILFVIGIVLGVIRFPALPALPGQ